MPVAIRLQRRGRRNRPFYRIVACDSRMSRDGRFVCKLGYYDPIPDPPEIKVDEEKTLEYLRNGAIPTPTVKDILRKVGIWEKFAKEKEAQKREKKLKEKAKKKEREK